MKYRVSIRHRVLIAGAALLVAAPAFADTIQLKNGTRIHGTIVENDGTFVVVEVGSRRLPYRVEEILSTEENDRTGTVDLAKVQERVNARNEALRQATGMSTEQFQELRAILKDLPSNDSEIAKSAHDRLIFLGSRVDLVSYFEAQLPRYSPRFVPRVLEAVYDLDKERAAPIARRHVFDLSDDCRLKALEILARLKDVESTEFFVRGLVDRNAAVRSACAEAVGVLEEKRTTPILMANLGHADRRVQNAARDVLLHFWSADLEGTLPQSLAEWQQTWESKLKGQVSEAISPEEIAPLVPANEHWQDE